MNWMLVLCAKIINNYVPQLFPQEDLNDLLRNLALSKEKAELLAFRLQQNNLLLKNVCATYFRKLGIKDSGMKTW